MDNLLVTIVGNRPQFIKMALISRTLKERGYSEYIIHSGQHYDEKMSNVFFDELGIPMPDISLTSKFQTHGKMTADFLSRFEEILEDLKPKGVMIYGDTNTSLAGALAAVKLKIPIAHVEAGPRIYDIDTPEEINRIVADHTAKLRFCPDSSSIMNLAKENINHGVYLTGDIMYDAYLYYSQVAKKKTKVLKGFSLEDEKYIFLTVHRPNNTDCPSALNNLINFIKMSPLKILFSVHPRTKNSFIKAGLWDKISAIDNVILLEPLGYLDTLNAVNNAEYIFTDSGGLQKEAFFAKKKCYIFFYETPWPQIKEYGWQKLLGCLDKIKLKNFDELLSGLDTLETPSLFGDGNARMHIVNLLERYDFV